MIAKRGCGKTSLIKDILQRYDQEFINNSLIISPKEKINPFYKKYFSNAEIIYDLNFNKIETYLDNKKPGAIILDDCLLSHQDLKNEIYANLMFNGRHYKKMVITTIQYPLPIPPQFRCNFDYVFMFNDDNVSNKKRLYDQYAGIFPSYYTFDNVFKYMTFEPYSSMVIKNFGVAKCFEDKVFWYKS